MHVQREVRVRAQGEQVAVYKPRREVSPETHPLLTLVLDFHPPDWEEINVCWWSLPGCGVLLWRPWLTNPHASENGVGATSVCALGQAWWAASSA